MFDPHDYDGVTFESEERDRREAEREEYDSRMESYDAGLVTLRAAIDGGWNYEMQMSESALELADAGIAQPIATALAGWRDAVAAQRRAA